MKNKHITTILLIISAIAPPTHGQQRTPLSEYGNNSTAIGRNKLGIITSDQKPAYASDDSPPILPKAQETSKNPTESKPFFSESKNLLTAQTEVIKDLQLQIDGIIRRLEKIESINQKGGQKP